MKVLITSLSLSHSENYSFDHAIPIKMPNAVYYCDDWDIVISTHIY